MNIKLAAATIGTALIIAGSPAFASAQTTQDAPVRLDNVRISQSVAFGSDPESAPGLVSISFTNQSAVAVTGVVFDLTDANGNILAQYNDVGSYPQGASVRHNFEDIHNENNQQIEVSEVRFADGTSWSSPSHATPAVTIFPGE